MGQVEADHNYLNFHRATLTNGSVSISGARAAPYHERTSHFTTRKFQATALSQIVDVEVLKMNASVYIWVGTASDSLGKLHHCGGRIDPNSYGCNVFVICELLGIEQASNRQKYGK